MFAYDVKKSVEEAKSDIKNFNKDNFRDLLKAYQAILDFTLKEYNGMESNIPYDHNYFYIKNKYQYVLNYFTKE